MATRTKIPKMTDNYKKLMIKEFVNAHCTSYFWFDHYREDEFKTMFTKFASTVTKKGLHNSNWYDTNGNFSYEKFVAAVLPAEKETESMIMDAFNKKFAHTDVKIEDCVKYAEEKYAQQLERIKANT